ncbi:hypothetical protein RI367_006331 [Sorochytrium milnesiophthora]
MDVVAIVFIIAGAMVAIGVLSWVIIFKYQHWRKQQRRRKRRADQSATKKPSGTSYTYSTDNADDHDSDSSSLDHFDVEAAAAAAKQKAAVSVDRRRHLVAPNTTPKLPRASFTAASAKNNSNALTAGASPAMSPYTSSELGSAVGSSSSGADESLNHGSSLLHPYPSAADAAAADLGSLHSSSLGTPLKHQPSADNNNNNSRPVSAASSSTRSMASRSSALLPGNNPSSGLRRSKSHSSAAPSAYSTTSTVPPVPPALNTRLVLGNFGIRTASSNASTTSLGKPAAAATTDLLAEDSTQSLHDNWNALYSRLYVLVSRAFDDLGPQQLPSEALRALSLTLSAEPNPADHVLVVRKCMLAMMHLLTLHLLEFTEAITSSFARQKLVSRLAISPADNLTASDIYKALLPLTRPPPEATPAAAAPAALESRLNEPAAPSSLSDVFTDELAIGAARLQDVFRINNLTPPAADVLVRFLVDWSACLVRYKSASPRNAIYFANTGAPNVPDFMQCDSATTTTAAASVSPPSVLFTYFPGMIDLAKGVAVLKCKVVQQE